MTEPVDTAKLLAPLSPARIENLRARSATVLKEYRHTNAILKRRAETTLALIARVAELEAERDELRALRARDAAAASMRLSASTASDPGDWEDYVGSYAEWSAATIDWLRARVAVFEAALRNIAAWDCLNPPAAQMCADLPWLKGLVEAALGDALGKAASDGG